MKAALSTAVLALAIAGCSGYSFHTNLDPSNFADYYKPSGAKVVEESDLEGVAYKVKGEVTGLSCQAKDQDPVATAARARTSARIKAVDMGANAVRFTKCVRLENTPACLVSYTCYGDALIVQEGK
jgi:RcsF protein